MVATGQRASRISLAISSAPVIDAMVENRRHLGEAKKATTASEKVGQPRNVVKTQVCVNLTNATSSMSHGKRPRRQEEDGGLIKSSHPRRRLRKRNKASRT